VVIGITTNNYLHFSYSDKSRSNWPSGLRRVSTADRLLGLRLRIPPGHGCLSVVSVVCLSGIGICDGPITRPEESYRLWCVLVCDLENRQNEAAG
jgi:hypothetical protein